MGCINIRATLIKEPIIPQISLTNEHLNVRFAIICTPNTDLYLKVIPTEVDIPVDGTPTYVQVYSNTSYKLNWDEALNGIITPSGGRGDALLPIGTNGANEGLNREFNLFVVTTEGEHVEHVGIMARQKGRRVRLRLRNGVILKTADNKKFNVLKEK